MWYLRIKYKHSDCLYTDKSHKLNISIFHYYLGSYVKDRYIYSSAFQHFEGEEKDIKKYISYLKHNKRVMSLEVFEKSVLILTKNKKELKTYSALYNPMFLYPNPAIVDRNGFEIVEIAFWEKKPLQGLISVLEKDKTTTHFEILKFVNRKMDDIYVTKLLPKLPTQQGRAIKLAYQFGYYEYPRKINLDKLAKIAKVSKATFRESLRRAEAKIIPQLISKK